MWLEISKIGTAEKPGPIQRLAARRIQDSGERIRMDTARLIHKGRLLERAGNGFTAPEWWLGAELLQYELLDRVIENSISQADAGFARPAGQLGQPAIARPRAPVESKARSEGFVVGTGQTVGHALVSRKNYPQRSNSSGVIAGYSRKDGGALPGPERLNSLAGISHWRVQFPAHAVVQRQIRFDLPTVLREKVHGFAANKFMLWRTLQVAGRQAHEIVREGIDVSQVISARRRR